MHHIKKVHILDWKLKAQTRLSPLDPCPPDAVGERSALKPSLLFLILYPAYKLARYRCCFVQVNPNLYPKHFSATSINASVNGDLNWSTSTASSSWQSLLSPSWIGHPKGMLVYGNARAWPFSFLYFFVEKKYDNIDLDCSQSSIFP